MESLDENRWFVRRRLIGRHPRFRRRANFMEGDASRRESALTIGFVKRTYRDLLNTV